VLIKNSKKEKKGIAYCVGDAETSSEYQLDYEPMSQCGNVVIYFISLNKKNRLVGGGLCYLFN
jgi:hypothetical protein